MMLQATKINVEKSHKGGEGGKVRVREQGLLGWEVTSGTSPQKEGEEQTRVTARRSQPLKGFPEDMQEHLRKKPLVYF
jgi:hypothetical protein